MVVRLSKRVFVLLMISILPIISPPSIAAQEEYPLVPLTTWYSANRGDYMTSSAVRWRRAVGTAIPGQGDYRAVRLEGYVYNPDRPQPPGTVSLYNWWSASRQDNLLTTDPDWSGDVGDLRPGQGDYRLFRIEGYVHRAPTEGTRALRQYWSGQRRDNWTTSDAAARDVSGYREYRVAGYLDAPPGEGDDESADAATSSWSDAIVQQVRFVFRTGSDDLRGGSYLTPFFVLRDGRRLEQHRINCLHNQNGVFCRRNFAEGTEHAFTWGGWNGPAVGDLVRMGIQFQSGRPSAFDTPDNWNLRALEVQVTGRMPDGSVDTRVLYSGAGTPLHRFRGSSQWETADLRRD